MASILMPLSETETKHGINFDATESFFYPAPIKTGLLIPYLVRGFKNFLPEGLIFPLSRDLSLEEDKTFFGRRPTKQSIFSHYLMRGFEIFLPKDLIFRPSRDLPLEREKVFSGTFKNTPLNLLASGGVPQEHPTPSPDKEVITTRQLNNRHRKRYDRATTSKERARRRRGDPGSGIQKPYRKDGALSQ